ncbi:MAG TPA: thylakoid membrane photosystem I accumulation factor [Oscillatoriales cyanobacterium M59_W2019_021]|nr:thylakoid membrane photosystem I accumulation factor [Oscillatoriales cyanobacterium M4454_W2019_049]HIK50538.1 thylakoid membrane photosystem I accumulation factor [Oscillatoriales cyanobacterium M59_W2019_021]
MVSLWRSLVAFLRRERRRALATAILSSVLVLLGVFWLATAPALASLEDDRFDGNIFALYAGNGSLVPPKVTLEQSLKQGKPTLLVLYLEDSRDSKAYSPTVSALQSFYGRVANFVPVNTDSIFPADHYEPTEPGYYYKGLVPQTVLFDASGKVVLDRVGQVPFEDIDDRFREIFDLLPRSQSIELRRANEISTEMSQ